VAATTERSLRDFGATFHNAIAPKQVMVWAPEQVERAERSLRDADWRNGTVNFGSCLKDTGPGDRGAVYETGGSGIVGFYDFSGRAGKRRNQPYRYMAAGVYRPLAKPISYAHLLDDHRLKPLFGKIQGKAALTDEEARAIMELAGRAPRHVAMPLPEWAEEVDGFFERDPDSPRRGRASTSCTCGSCLRPVCGRGSGSRSGPRLRSGPRIGSRGTTSSASTSESSSR